MHMLLRRLVCDMQPSVASPRFLLQGTASSGQLGRSGSILQAIHHTTWPALEGVFVPPGPSRENNPGGPRSPDPHRDNNLCGGGGARTFQELLRNNHPGEILPSPPATKLVHWPASDRLLVSRKCRRATSLSIGRSVVCAVFCVLQEI